MRIIYANSDHENGKYIKEAINSAKSFRKYIPNASIELYTNTKEDIDPVFNKVHFTQFTVPKVLENKLHQRGQMLVKMQAMLDTHHDLNLYLGSDTYALDHKVLDPFRLLDRYDFAMVHAPHQYEMQTEIPSCFREWNCDVIYWRKNKMTQNFIAEWRRLYQNDIIDHPHDQGSFRHLAYQTQDVNVFTLSYHYNNRLGLYGSQNGAHHSSHSDIKGSVIIQNRDVVNKIINDKS